jgi:hypothetical protein
MLKRNRSGRAFEAIYIVFVFETSPVRVKQRETGHTEIVSVTTSLICYELNKSIWLELCLMMIYHCGNIFCALLIVFFCIKYIAHWRQVLCPFSNVGKGVSALWNHLHEVS